jgi:tellurite resistance protein TerC
MFRAAIHVTYKLARRIVVAVVGVTVLFIGIAMIVLPGPAFLVIPIGLAILGAEFAWARHWLHALKDKTKGALNGLNKLGYKSKSGPVEKG